MSDSEGKKNEELVKQIQEGLDSGFLSEEDSKVSVVIERWRAKRTSEVKK